MENTPLTPAERVARVIKELEMTSYQFGKATGISHQTLSNVLTGKNKPGLDTLQAIAAHYPAAAVFLLTGEGEPFPGGRYNEKPTPATPAPAVAQEPEPPTEPSSGLRVNRDDEQEAYWKGLAQERLRENEFLKELLRGAYGIRPADEEQEAAASGGKKEYASSNAADLRSTVNELANIYQYRIVAHGIGFVPGWMAGELETA